jgi:hypothetical protein
MLRLGVLTAFLCCLPQLLSVKPLRRSRFQPNRSVTPRLRQASQRIIANLQPGNHTAIVRGVNNTTGVALVEVYELN